MFSIPKAENLCCLYVRNLIKQRRLRSVNVSQRSRLEHGTPRRTEIEKKMPGYDTHIF